MCVNPGEKQSTAAVALQALDTAREALQLAAAAAEASRYASAAVARSTLRTYAAYWESYAAWCADNAVSALPADGGTVALYIAWRARTHAPATIAGELAAIASAHRAAGMEDPTRDQRVKTVLRGIRRTKGVRQAKKTPLVVEALRAVLDELDDSVRGRRDRCMLLIGWTGALRRSELVAIDHEDLTLAPEGLVLTIRRSKTDRYGAGDNIGLPKHKDARYDVVRAYLGWVERSGAHEGPVFRPIEKHGYVLPRRLNDRSVALLVKRVAKRAGLSGDYSGHSLRAGLATSAAAHGAGEASIMRQTRHQSVTIMRGYIRPASVWWDNAAAVAAL
jgi:integrase